MVQFRCLLAALGRAEPLAADLTLLLRAPDTGLYRCVSTSDLPKKQSDAVTLHRLHTLPSSDTPLHRSLRTRHGSHATRSLLCND